MDEEEKEDEDERRHHRDPAAPGSQSPATTHRLRPPKFGPRTTQPYPFPAFLVDSLCSPFGLLAVVCLAALGSCLPAFLIRPDTLTLPASGVIFRFIFFSCRLDYER